MPLKAPKTSAHPARLRPKHPALRHKAAALGICLSLLLAGCANGIYAGANLSNQGHSVGGGVKLYGVFDLGVSHTKTTLQK